MVDVSILIVCYKSRDYILNCLRSAIKHTIGCRYEILLVDCSSDGTIDLVMGEFPQVRIIQNSENLGFGRGNNLLAEHAIGQFYVLLNPDVIVTDDSIGELYRAAILMPKAGAIGGRTRLPDGTRDPSCRQSVPTLFRLAVSAFGGARFVVGGLSEDAKQPAEVEALSGAFMLVRREAWLDVNGFDTSYFMYSEELDLCMRLRKKRWEIVMTPLAEIIHLVGGGDGQNPRRIFLLTVSRMHFFRKFWGPAKVIIGGLILWMHAAVRVVLAIVAGPLIGRDRAGRLLKAYIGIVARPQEWWDGFSARWIRVNLAPIPANADAGTVPVASRSSV